MDSKEKNTLNNEHEIAKKNEDLTIIKAYKSRWIILGIYCYYCSINAIQWLEHSSIPLIVAKYYQVSTLAVDWTATSFLALYIIFFMPASYIIDRYGLRVTALLGCGLSFISCVIKLFALERDTFWILMVAQCTAAAAQCLILCLPTKVAAVWFQAKEVSTACTIGCVAQLVGNALGFLIPPMLATDHENPEDIGKDFKVLYWTMVAYATPALLAVIFYFPKEPKHPPSAAQAEVRKFEEEVGDNLFYETLKSLLSNRAFNLHSLAAGLNVGVFSGVTALLSQFVLMYFPNENTFAGMLGFSMLMISLPFSLIVGFVMDKTRKYKEINVIIYAASLLGVVLLTLSLDLQSKTLVSISCAVIGLSCGAYFSAAFEFGVELTFPNEEGMTTTILLAATQILGSIGMPALGHIIILIGPYWALMSQAGILLVGLIAACVVPNRLLRQQAQRRGTQQYESVLQVEGVACEK